LPSAALDHHPAIFLFRHAGHAARHLLKAFAVGGTNLGEEIDVAAERDAAVEIAVENRLLLLFRHGPFIEIGALVRLEPGPVIGLHQGHAELVQPVAVARLVGVENRRAGNVEIGLV
jgi:hypothetical protein